jgi:hypothetical protein
MIQAYLASGDSRLQREDAQWWADTVQCHGAPATLDASPTADCKGFP